MEGDKPTEGLIPEGLVVSNLHGEVGGVLTISGVVEKSDIKVGHLIISDAGAMRNGSVEATEATIRGCASNVLFRVSRLSVMEAAQLSDCIIEINQATGFLMCDTARFEGEIKLTTRKYSDFSSYSHGNISESDIPDAFFSNIEHTDTETNIPLGD